MGVGRTSAAPTNASKSAHYLSQPREGAWLDGALDADNGRCSSCSFQNWSRIARRSLGCRVLGDDVIYPGVRASGMGAKDDRKLLFMMPSSK